MLRGVKQNHVWTRTWEPHMRLSQTCLWVFECLLQQHGSAMACCGDRGSGCNRPGRHSMWASPESHRADNPQTGEQLYQRSFHTIVKVLGPTTDFPAWGIQQRDWETPGNLTLKASGIWLQNLYRTGKTDSWRVQTKHCAHQAQEKGTVIPQETGPDLPVSVQEPPAEARVCSGLLQSQGHSVLQCVHRIVWRRSVAFVFVTSTIICS